MYRNDVNVGLMHSPPQTFTGALPLLCDRYSLRCDRYSGNVRQSAGNGDRSTPCLLLSTEHRGGTKHASCVILGLLCLFL